jgi:ArsR family transcriptional regulator
MNKEELSVKLFRALGHPLRLKIIKILCECPSCVNDLHRILGCSQPNLSQHLKILSEAGILENKKVSSHIFYKVKNKKMVERILKDVEEYVDILQKESIESLGDNN